MEGTIVGDVVGRRVCSVTRRNPVRSRRWLLSSSATVAAGAAAAACTTGGKPGGGEAPKALLLPRTVEYWTAATPGTGLAGMALNALVQRYQELNPGVTLNTGVSPMTAQVPEKTVAAVAAGTPPDVAQFDRFLIATFALRDLFTDLTPLFKRDGITAKEYFPPAWAEASYRGKVYARPYQTGIRALLANRGHLREAGLNPDQPVKTVAELDQWSQRLTRQEGDSYTRVGFAPAFGEGGSLYIWGWQFGGDFYDEKTNKCVANQPKTVGALEWMGGYARRLGDERLRAFEGTFSAAGGAFPGGLVSVLLNTQDSVNSLARNSPTLDYMAMPLPPTPGQSKNATFGGGFGYIVPHGVKQVDASWHLAKFLGSDEGELIWTQTTLSLPVRVNVLNSPFWQEQARNPNMRVFLDLLPIAHWRPVMPAGQILSDGLVSAVDQVRKGQLAPKQALDELTQRVNAELARIGN